MFGFSAKQPSLGVVQGVSEFLPSRATATWRSLSSFRLRAGVAFTVLFYAGTLLATALVLRTELFARCAEGFRRWFDRRASVDSGGRDALSVLLATLPSLAIGWVLTEHAVRLTDNPLVIGLGLLGTTAALVLAHFSVQGDREQPTHAGALLIGVAQGLAVLPGLSRSSSTSRLRCGSACGPGERSSCRC